MQPFDPQSLDSLSLGQLYFRLHDLEQGRQELHHESFCVGGTMGLLRPNQVVAATDMQNMWRQAYVVGHETINDTEYVTLRWKQRGRPSFHKIPYTNGQQVSCNLSPTRAYEASVETMRIEESIATLQAKIRQIDTMNSYLDTCAI